MIISNLGNRELGEWCEAWARKNLPNNGNVQRIILEMAKRLNPPGTGGRPHAPESVQISSDKP